MKHFFIFLVLITLSTLVIAQEYVGVVVADTPGAYGAYWHTSVTLTNPSEQDAKIPFTLYLSSGGSFKMEIVVPALNSISKLLIEILKEKGIELPSFFGWVEIDVSNIPEGFTGETLMYTPDPNAGEGAIFAERTEMFTGDIELALYPLTPCGKDAKEPMALGGAVWRTNVGFVNTSSKATKAEIECYDGDFTFLVRTEIGLNPKEIKQLNDIKRPEIWNLPCDLIKEPVVCFVNSTDTEALVYAYGANNNNVNNFPIYIPPQ